MNLEQDWWRLKPATSQSILQPQNMISCELRQTSEGIRTHVKAVCLRWLSWPCSVFCVAYQHVSHMAVKSFNNHTVTSASHWKDLIPLDPMDQHIKDTLLHILTRAMRRLFLVLTTLTLFQDCFTRHRLEDYLAETVRTMCRVSLMLFSLSLSSVNWTHNRQTSINQTPKNVVKRQLRGLKPETPIA